jgi:hypothetical protein
MSFSKRLFKTIFGEPDAPPRVNDERGDTLVEILLAIVIIGLTVTATLGAFATSISASTTQSGSDAVGLAATNDANDLYHNIVSAGPFSTFSSSWCQSGSPSSLSPYPNSYNQSGYSFVESVSWLTNNTWVTSGSPCVTTSANGPVSDPQLVTITATGPSLNGKVQPTSTVSFVVTSPNNAFLPTNPSISSSGGLNQGTDSNAPTSGCTGVNGYECWNNGAQNSGNNGYSNSNGQGTGGFGSRSGNSYGNSGNSHGQGFGSYNFGGGFSGR